MLYESADLYKKRQILELAFQQLWIYQELDNKLTQI